MPVSYYTPTRVVFGKDAISELKTELKLQNATKVLLHTGGSSAKKSGLLDKVISILDESNIAHVELPGVKANPRLSLVREGIALGKKEGVDFIIALGGGSVIDSSKAIGYGLKYDGNVWDFYSGKAKPVASVGVGVVLTISAAGSEMSDSSVITNDEDGWLKRGCNSDVCRAKFAIMDPTYTFTLPPYQSSCGTVDIIMHTLERFFHSGYGISLTDNLAAALIKTVMVSGKKVLENPEDYEARASIMWASSISHNGLMQVGNENRGDWSCHQIEHELSGMFDVAHGAGLSVVFPAWARYIYKAHAERFAKLGNLVFGLEGDNKKVALETIEKFEEFFSSINMPVHLSEMNITLDEETMEKLLDKLTNNNTRTLGIFHNLKREDMKKIYEIAQ